MSFVQGLLFRATYGLFAPGDWIRLVNPRHQDTLNSL